MSTRIILIILFFVISFKGYTQKKLETTALNRVTFIKNDTLFRFFILKPEKKVSPKPGANYYWYRPDTILITTYGFDGRLLDGEYSVFYPNKNIKESGTFDKGLKTGEWKAWDTNGKLLQIYNWKKGHLEGDFIIFDGNGIIDKQGRYQNDSILIIKDAKIK